MNDENNDKPASEGSREIKSDAASRARNKTVMLTPEVTGQLRALLNREESAPPRAPDPLSNLLPQAKEGGFGNVSSDSEAFARPDRGGGTLRGSMSAIAPQQPSFAVHPKPSRVAPSSKIVGFLVSYDNTELGEIFEIRAGRWLLTSKPTDHGDNIIIEDQSISPLHAIIRATLEGKVQILDQLSEHGTAVTRPGEYSESEVAGSLVDVGHGDMIRFGKRKFVLCMVPN